MKELLTSSRYAHMVMYRMVYASSEFRAFDILWTIHPTLTRNTSDDCNEIRRKIRLLQKEPSFKVHGLCRLPFNILMKVTSFFELRLHIG